MKKIFSILLSLVMVLSLSTTAFSKEPTMTVEQASEYVALSFMRNSLGKNIEVSETTPFYDLENNITAYHVAFTENNSPNGYVLISLINPENPIVEFAFEGIGLVETVEEKQGNSRTYSSASNNIYFLGAGNLYTGDSTSYLQNIYDGEICKAQEINERYQDAMASTPMASNDVVIADGILSWADASIDSKSIVKIPEFGVGSDYWLMTDFSTGNVCAPTCATNILWYWGVQRGYTWVVENGDKTGKDLASGLFTAMSMHMQTAPALGTLNVFIKNAYTSFIGFRGTNYKITALTDNKYSDFTAAVRSGNPVHTMLRNTSIFSTGHDVMTLGFGKSTSGTDYLFVMDGWYDHGRFVDFNFFPIVKGIEVNIGPTPN